MVRVILAALCAILSASLSSAMTTQTTLRTRQPSRVSSAAISCRLGDLSGDQSKRIDLKQGRICETSPLGKQVCRKVSRQALGEHDALDEEFVEVEDLPSWWILRAEEEFRSTQQNGKLDQIE